MFTRYRLLRREGLPVTFALMAVVLFRDLHEASEDALVGPFAQAALQLRLF